MTRKKQWIEIKQGVYTIFVYGPWQIYIPLSMYDNKTSTMARVLYNESNSLFF